MRGLGRDAFGDFGGVGVAEIDADAEGDDGEEDAEVSRDVVGDATDGGVGAESEGDDDASGPGCDGEGKRIEDFLFEGAVGVVGDFFFGAVGGGVLLIEEGPAHGGEDQASGDLYDREREAEEGQDRGADQLNDD